MSNYKVDYEVFVKEGGVLNNVFAPDSNNREELEVDLQLNTEDRVKELYADSEIKDIAVTAYTEEKNIV